MRLHVIILCLQQNNWKFRHVSSVCFTRFHSTVDYIEYVKAICLLVLQASCRRYYSSSDGSTFVVLAQSQSAEATVAGGDGVILLFNVENSVPMSTGVLKRPKVSDSLW